MTSMALSNSGRTDEINGTLDNSISSSKIGRKITMPKDTLSLESNTTTSSSIANTSTTESIRNGSFSNMSLEYKLKQLRDESIKHGQALTQKLATSQSGQNLLHIGTSLSTLPPDLHQLVSQLHPIISACEITEKKQVQRLEHFMTKLADIQSTNQRVIYSQQLKELFQDLTAAESIIRKHQHQQKHQLVNLERKNEFMTPLDEEDGDVGQERIDELHRENDELDAAAALERAAHISLSLMGDLQYANDFFTTALNKGSGGDRQAHNAEDAEHAQFIVKLSPRIRRLESDTVACLSTTIESMLMRIQQQEKVLSVKTKDDGNQTITTGDDIDDNDDSSSKAKQQRNEWDNIDSVPEEERTLLVLGHSMRGLALLGRPQDVESIFARTAILPLIRSKISMGLLDEGGARGECAGLPNLLRDITSSIANAYHPLLVLAESMFSMTLNETETLSGCSSSVGIDLVTVGVWVPIVTALMADNAIKMAIFSPGIASILQANYVTLDRFLSQLANTLLNRTSTSEQQQHAMNQYYFQPKVTTKIVQQAQDRIYSHPKTAEFSKKWNLPIYYQLRFGEFCARLNKAVDKTQRGGWAACDVFTGPIESAEAIKNTVGFELGLFLELYSILNGLWRADVMLRPLTHRFLRGAIQIVGRVSTFVSEGMEGELLFGDESSSVQPSPQDHVTDSSLSVSQNGSSDVGPTDEQFHGTSTITPYVVHKAYCWGESEEDVASVAWELSILESWIRHDYSSIVLKSIMNNQGTGLDLSAEAPDMQELKGLIEESLQEASSQIHPVIDKGWNVHIVRLLIGKCSGPLAAVKGVAATYRMTNRPPPTQASPFVITILRPLKEFDTEFANRIPERVGLKWKQQIVVTVSERYANAVEELIVTVQRTEEALKNRKARRTAVGGTTAMSDGDKVKLQLYFDYQMFATNVREVGIEPSTVLGLSKLQELTVEGQRFFEQLQQRQQN